MTSLAIYQIIYADYIESDKTLNLELVLEYFLNNSDIIRSVYAVNKQEETKMKQRILTLLSDLKMANYGIILLKLVIEQYPDFMNHVKSLMPVVLGIIQNKKSNNLLLKHSIMTYCLMLHSSIDKSEVLKEIHGMNYLGKFVQSLMGLYETEKLRATVIQCLSFLALNYPGSLKSSAESIKRNLVQNIKESKFLKLSSECLLNCCLIGAQNSLSANYKESIDKIVNSIEFFSFLYTKNVFKGCKFTCPSNADLIFTLKEIPKDESVAFPMILNHIRDMCIVLKVFLKYVNHLYSLIGRKSFGIQRPVNISRILKLFKLILMIDPIKLESSSPREFDIAKVHLKDVQSSAYDVLSFVIENHPYLMKWNILNEFIEYETEFESSIKIESFRLLIVSLIETSSLKNLKLLAKLKPFINLDNKDIALQFLLPIAQYHLNSMDDKSIMEHQSFILKIFLSDEISNMSKEMTIKAFEVLAAFSKQTLYSSSSFMSVTMSILLKHLNSSPFAEVVRICKDVLITLDLVFQPRKNVKTSLIVDKSQPKSEKREPVIIEKVDSNRLEEELIAVDESEPEQPDVPTNPFILEYESMKKRRAEEEVPSISSKVPKVETKETAPVVSTIETNIGSTVDSDDDEIVSIVDEESDVENE